MSGEFSRIALRCPLRNTRRARRNTHRGFTIVELMMVIAVIGIITAIAVPNLIAARAAARRGWFQATARAIGSSIEVFAQTNRGRYPMDGLFFGPPGRNAAKWEQDSGMPWIGFDNPSKQPTWSIDYQVHPSPVAPGAHYIGLCYSGLRGAPADASITNNASLWNNYGLGQEIPGDRRLIFIFHQGVPADRICPNSTCTP